MVCIREKPCEIMGKNLTLAGCLDLIMASSEEVYMVPGGYRLGNILLAGAAPFSVGVAGETLFFQYVKPCFGIFAMKMDGCPDEICALRSAYYLGKSAGGNSPDRMTAPAIRRIK